MPVIPLSAQIPLPSWVWGGHPERFFEEAGLRAQQRGRYFEVQAEERYLHAPADLVSTVHIAGPHCRRPQFDYLNDLGRPDRSPPNVDEHIRKQAERADRSNNPVDAFVLWQLMTTSASERSLPQVVEQCYNELKRTEFTEGDPEQVFPHAGVHVVHRRRRLLTRTYLAPLMLRFEFDPQLAQGDISGMKLAHNAGEMIFAAGGGLRAGIILFDAYLGPLMLALTPFIWAFTAHREFGVVIYTLERALAGASGSGSELLQLQPVEGPYESIAAPTLTKGASRAAIAWWIAALNRMFAQVTDPAVFTDHEGVYSPSKHLHAMLTVEQLFRRVASIQIAHRDLNARRALFFTVLDTLERLTGRNLELLCTLSFARTTLQKVSQVIPADAGSVLLPAAKRGVSALESLQQGFFIRSADDMVEIKDDNSQPITLPLERATAEYIKILRNATHGHGAKRQKPRTSALLAVHDGDVPHDLGLLGYLYLLDLLLRPDDLALHLYSGGAA